MFKYYRLIATLFLLFTGPAFAQVTDFSSIPKSDSDKLLKNGQPADLGHSHFPLLKEYRDMHIFTINDSVFGAVPFRLFIPQTYDPSVATPLVLLLHGAVGASHFSDAMGQHRVTEADDDPFIGKLCKTGNIIIMPYGDETKKFSWVVNKWRPTENLTFKTLLNIINEVKRSVNINDDKVFAMGHSDGSDGAFALDVYNPTPFAGFLCYNSMLTNLAANDIYLRNATNKPLYAVHSNKDDIRPIEQARVIIKLLDSLKTNVKYKEYYGYQHFDKHLDLDYPNALKFIDSTRRTPYPKAIFWETSSHLFSNCNWLVINNLDIALNAAPWHKAYNIGSYYKNTKTWKSYPYYSINPSAAIKGTYNNNTFEIYTSRVTAFEVLISPQMVDINKEVKIILNGKTAFAGKVKADGNFFKKQFAKTHDRKAVWVAAVPVRVVN
ncbi:hypothetical protein [Mucilaginibacter ginsenosidivorax]|uniref:Phospholipase/carboxylesterase/thioesterase domain-containing protein n=2 Tax=Mucilaginibacter ginsenosidivorax TaxID=862126 RepID=A0A5B8VWD8_9SPHI|nr:hypothetical protein [Mucilaginibacter ginsenosidivorax]QEC75907.1 hypothetical protein FSB76_08085 [Mucilaginibacter ginsenosidivorax]